jgi:hypothetical protein
MLPSLDAGDGGRIAGHHCYAQVGAEGFGGRADDGPARLLLLHQCDVGRAGDRTSVVIFDQENVTAPQDPSKRECSAPGECRAGRILCTRRDEKRLHRP